LMGERNATSCCDDRSAFSSFGVSEEKKDKSWGEARYVGEDQTRRKLSRLPSSSQPARPNPRSQSLTEFLLVAHETHFDTAALSFACNGTSPLLSSYTFVKLTYASPFPEARRD
jgi:hypothetical protein